MGNKNHTLSSGARMVYIQLLILVAISGILGGYSWTYNYKALIYAQNQAVLEWIIASVIYMIGGTVALVHLTRTIKGRFQGITNQQSIRRIWLMTGFLLIFLILGYFGFFTAINIHPPSFYGR